MVKRLCISVTDEDAEFLDVMQLSPSGICKQRIEEIKRDSRNYHDKLKILEGARDAMAKKIAEYDKLLTENGIIH